MLGVGALTALGLMILLLFLVACCAGYVVGWILGAISRWFYPDLWILGAVSGPSFPVLSGRLGGAIAFFGALLYLFSPFLPAGVNERVEDERVEECKARVAAWRATGRRGEPPLCRGGWVVPAPQEGRDQARRERRIRHLRNVR